MDFPANIKDTAGVCYGYRVYVRLRNGDGTALGQVYQVPNSVITGHSVTMNADGTTEETMEFTSSVMPIQLANATAGEFSTAQTAAGQF